MKSRWMLAVLASALPVALAQDCISLEGSKTCPAFDAASISTNSDLVAAFPFLAFVSDLDNFDTQLEDYVTREYVQQKYQNILGCDKVDTGNTSALYARYTTSFLCNGIVQNSRQPCKLAGADSRPLCADSCAELAISEQKLTSSAELCGRPTDDYVDLIRADFTNCALPADSLSGSCISGSDNEKNNCGFGPSIQGLCDYCRASSENATDSCCIGSNATSRCEDVVLPQFTLNPTLLATNSPTSASAPAPSATSEAAAAAASNRGLSQGQLAGVITGAVIGGVLLFGLLLACCLLAMGRRKRKRSSTGSLLNQPTPPRRGVQSMQQVPPGSAQHGYEVLPGGRVARMSALQGPGENAQAFGALAGTESRRGYDTSDSDRYEDASEHGPKMKEPMPQRGGSLSSNSVFPVGQDSSPNTDSNNYSSPEGAHGQSEQLSSFKDYYSSDEIHPNDKVSVLWAYQPRAGDEFELERGDMLRVVGIWDDGWATGIRIDDRADEYESKHNVQRDSGVSNGSGNRASSPPQTGEIKAFPLVCVCLPEAWKKTVEGDTSADSPATTRPGT